jgi:tetratricopeptide (TPR) repeat protein
MKKINKPVRNYPPHPIDHPAKRNKTSETVSPILAFPLIVLAAAIAFGPALFFGVTAFDDDKIIGIFAGSPHTLADALASNAFMEHKGQDFYRPLQSLSFMADAALSGGGPAIYHLTNILIHAIAACCLWRLLILLGFGEKRSLAAALVFAVHPLFAQAVAWIPGRGDLLLGLTGILTLAALVKYRKSGKFRYAALTTAALFTALLAKENAMALPFLLCLYIVQVDGKKCIRPRNIALEGSWFAVSLVYILLRKEAMSGLPGAGTFGIGPLVGNLRVLPEMLAGFFVPWNIPVLPSFTLLSTIIGFCAAILIVFTLAARRRMTLLALFGALWYVGLLLPGMLYRQLLGAHAFTYLNHRSYLPMVGIIIVLMVAIPSIGKRVSARLPVAAFAIVLIILCLLAHRQSAFFADSITFYNQAIRTNPSSAFALNNRASLRSERGDIQGAIQDMDAALRLDPDFPACLLNRGILAAYVGDTVGACGMWVRAAGMGNGMAEDMVKKYCK